MQRMMSTTSTVDETLLTQCLAGDESAWTQLVAKYSRLVFSIALKSGLGDEDAAEVVQNVFIIVLRRLEQLQHAERFSAWLITTTHRESWRHKKALRVEHMDPDLDVADDAPEPDADVIAWEQASVVHEALTRIDGRCKRLIQLLFLTEPRPPYEDISAELEISVGSIGPIRARCLKRLRDNLVRLGVTA